MWEGRKNGRGETREGGGRVKEGRNGVGLGGKWKEVEGRYERIDWG